MSGALRVALASAALIAPAKAETLAEFDDAEARLQYAFFTADARALQNVLALIESYEVDERLAPTKSYQLAHGYWKLAQLHAETQHRTADTRTAASLASKAARACLQHARAARDQDKRMAEAYAIEAACDGMPRGFLRSAGLTSSCSRSKPLRTALSLEPENPRVLLIAAMCAGANDDAALVRWRKVADAFGAAPMAGAGKPDWGEAETLVVLGEQYLQRGEKLAARDALERALVVAPDYAAARELLAVAAVGGR